MIITRKPEGKATRKSGKIFGQSAKLNYINLPANLFLIIFLKNNVPIYDDIDTFIFIYSYFARSGEF